MTIRSPFLFALNCAGIGMFGTLILTGDPDTAWNWMALGLNVAAVALACLNGRAEKMRRDA